MTKGTKLNRGDTQREQKKSYILILYVYKKLSLAERYLIDKFWDKKERLKVMYI